MRWPPAYRTGQTEDTSVFSLSPRALCDSLCAPYFCTENANTVSDRIVSPGFSSVLGNAA
jgi:hypothetical protein